MTDAQLVGIGMGVDTHHLADQQILEACTGGLHRVDLESGHGQLLDQFLG